MCAPGEGVQCIQEVAGGSASCTVLAYAVVLVRQPTGTDKVIVPRNEMAPPSSPAPKSHEAGQVIGEPADMHHDLTFAPANDTVMWALEPQCPDEGRLDPPPHRAFQVTTRHPHAKKLTAGKGVPLVCGQSMRASKSSSTSPMMALHTHAHTSNRVARSCGRVSSGS